MIERIINDRELSPALETIKASFLTVAQQYHLTKENCPTNAVFMEMEDLKALFHKGLWFFQYKIEGETVGFIGVEKSKKGIGVYYIEKLAVLPGFRNRGIGKELMEYAEEFIKKRRGKRISLAMINENGKLKDWYKELGFRETEMKSFPHLPFNVCFMEKFVKRPSLFLIYFF